MVDPSTNFMTIKCQLAELQNIKDSADNETLSGNGVKAFDKICLYGPDKVTEMRSEATIADQEIDTDEIIYMVLRVGGTFPRIDRVQSANAVLFCRVGQLRANRNHHIRSSSSGGRDKRITRLNLSVTDCHSELGSALKLLEFG
jgi:hypothetical protein